MNHRPAIRPRYAPSAPGGLGCCGCDQQDVQLGLFGIGSALKDLGRTVAKPFESIGREARRAYDRVEDAIKPFLPQIAAIAGTIGGSMIGMPSLGMTAGSLVGGYRQVRDLGKMEKAELDYARSELPKQLMQRACTGGLPLDCAAYGGIPQQLTGELQTIAQQLRAVHSESIYRQAITAAGESPGPAIEAILMQQDQHAQAWAQEVARQQRGGAVVAPAEKPVTASLLPWAAAGALLMVAVVR